MRQSQLFGRTLRESPKEAELVSHELSLRAGLIRQLAAGIYSYLPLGWRVLQKIETIMREEMAAVGCQELSMPVVQPAELWQKTNRWYDIGSELARFKDRTDRDLVLAMTHEEVATDIVRREIRSYRQLPFSFFHIQTKFRDEPRSRGGLMRVREFTMKDAYSFHADLATQEGFYQEMMQAYFNIFRHCGLEVLAVQSDVGMMGGTEAHEFMLVADSGEDTILVCSGCDYSANMEIATMDKGLEEEAEPPGELEEVATPDTPTIEGLARFLGMPKHKMAKVVLYWGDDHLVMALIRGDLEVNEVKLANVLRCPNLRLAADGEIAAAGLVAGYVSPVGVEGVQVVVDDTISSSRNLVSGANRAGFHLKNVNCGRDFQPDIVADIAATQAGGRCLQCGGRLELKRCFEVGNIFRLGTKYSQALGATYLDEKGKEHPIVMGSYGIGTGRLMASIIEVHNDDKGIIWPPSVAPFHCHVVALGLDKPEVSATAEGVCSELRDRGYEVLYDDREESAGVKFNDADLIGIPLRVTVSERNVRKDQVELKLRWEGQAERTGRSALLEAVERLLGTPGAVGDPP